MTPNTPATNPQTDLAVAAARADDRREIERLRAELVAVRDQAARETTFRALAEMRLERAEQRIAAVRSLILDLEFDPDMPLSITGALLDALDPQTPTSGPESPADGLAGSNACSDTPEGGEGL